MSDELVNDPTPDERPINQVERFWYKMGWFGVAVCIGFIIFQIYLGVNLRLVPNTQYINQTVNGVVSVVPVILFGPSDFVPKAPMTNTFVFMEIIWMLVIIVLIFRAFANTDTLITIRQAKDIVEHELEYIQRAKTNPEFEGIYHITLNGKLQHIVLKDDTRQPFKWWLGVNIRKGNLLRYYAISVGAFDKRLKDVVPIAAEFNGEMICANCGQFADIRWIQAAELMKFKEGIKGLGGGR